MRYPVVIQPNRLLTTKARAVSEITEELVKLLDDMHETMLAHDGVGLAAPQIGKSIRVAVIQAEEDEEIIELINPELIQAQGQDIDIEACLSIPGVYGLVPRFSQIVVRYYDRDGVEYEIEADDFLARIIQHEMDHLDGILFTDKAQQLLSEEALEKYMEEQDND